MDEGSTEGSSTYELRWPFSAAATFVGLMWIAYGWSIWIAKGTSPNGAGIMFGSLTNVGYYVAGALDTSAVVQDGAWERLASGIFLHGGFLHIIMNSAAILQLGRVLELFTTRGRCWFTLLFSGLCGSLTALAWAHLTHQPQNAIGASGAGCGLGTALIVLSRGIAPLTEFRKQMITWVVVMLAMGLLPIISGTGHAGGALGGALAGLLIARRGSVQFRDRYSRFLDRGTVFLTLVFVAALALNAWRAEQRRTAFEAIQASIDDAYAWLDAGKISDPGPWKAHLEELDLPSAFARIRGDLIMLVDALTSQDGGVVDPKDAEGARALLERLRAGVPLRRR